MLLTLDISNTSIKAGVFRGDELLANWRIATERHKLTDDYGMLLLNSAASLWHSGQRDQWRVDVVRGAAAAPGV